MKKEGDGEIKGNQGESRKSRRIKKKAEKKAEKKEKAEAKAKAKGERELTVDS
ncbi:MAG: hypothetical protein PHP99_03265 [Paludibacter sp.]|nr:hypothetical protein [Paludibacter sp.]